MSQPNIHSPPSLHVRKLCDQLSTGNRREFMYCISSIHVHIHPLWGLTLPTAPMGDQLDGRMSSTNPPLWWSVPAQTETFCGLCVWMKRSMKKRKLNKKHCVNYFFYFIFLQLKPWGNIIKVLNFSGSAFYSSSLKGPHVSLEKPTFRWGISSKRRPPFSWELACISLVTALYIVCH